jgi:hypothetical protein
MLGLCTLVERSWQEEYSVPEQGFWNYWDWLLARLFSTLGLVASAYLSLHSPSPLLSPPKLAVLPLPLLWCGCCHEKHHRKFHLGLFLNLVLDLVADHASFPTWCCTDIVFHFLVVKRHAGFHFVTVWFAII